MHWSGPFLLLLAYNACLINFLSAKSANYYETLGIQKSASAREIKRAFRKMALKYHPDKNKGDPDAEKKFVELAKAYEILSDTDKRNQYDQFGEAAFDNQGPSESPFHFNDFFKDFDSFFADMDIHQHGTDDIHNGFLVEDDDDGDVFGSPFGGILDDFDDFVDFDDFDGFEDHSHHHSQHNHQHQSVHDMRRSSSSRSHGGPRCKTVTNRVGNMVSTHTVCS